MLFRSVTESYVMQIEHGTKQLSVMNAKKLADLFGCRIEDFLEEAGEDARETGDA